MDCFLTLQNQLFEQLNSLWESDDEEILEKIDELLLQEGSNYGLSLNEKANLRKELFRSIRKLDVLQELLEDTSITILCFSSRVFIVMASLGNCRMVKIGPSTETGGMTALTRAPFSSLASTIGCRVLMTRLQRATIC